MPEDYLKTFSRVTIKYLGQPTRVHHLSNWKSLYALKWLGKIRMLHRIRQRTMSVIRYIYIQYKIGCLNHMHDIRDRVWLIPVVADGFELQRPVTAFNGLCDTGCCSFCAFPQLTIKTHLSSPSWNKLVDRKHFIIIPQFFQQQMNALSVYECVTQATLFYILLFPPVVESWYFGFLSQLYERDQG